MPSANVTAAGRARYNRGRLVFARHAGSRRDSPAVGEGDSDRPRPDPCPEPSQRPGRDTLVDRLAWRLRVGGRPELHQRDLAPVVEEVLAQVRVGPEEAHEGRVPVGLALGEVELEDDVAAVGFGHGRSPCPCNRSEA